MKIQCDMCEKKEASVYCTADEASLCHACDCSVHHANKLASKHQRFSLHHSSDQSPSCDICQEQKAFLFCKEDRAILCKQCDTSIHGANKHTQYHNRFLLAGVKLSESSTCYDSLSDQALCSSNSNGSFQTISGQKVEISNKSTSVNDHGDSVSQGEGASMESTGISEYLIETLPGWHVEDFLDPSATNSYVLYEGYDNDTCTLPFMAYDTDNNGDFGTLWVQDIGILANSSSIMDHKKSTTSSLSKRLYSNQAESYDKLSKDQYTFNHSSIKRPRQIW